MHAFPYERTKRQGGEVWEDFLGVFYLGRRQKNAFKKMHRRRANSRAVFRAHEIGESLRVETTKWEGGEDWEDFEGVF